MRRPRTRFWLEALLATTTAVLTVLTVLVPTWIEAAFDIDPDTGNGSVELAILAVLATATVTLVAGTHTEWRLAAASS